MKFVNSVPAMSDLKPLFSKQFFKPIDETTNKLLNEF